MCKITINKTTLSNGLTVVNLLSTHDFKFDDGTTLAGINEQMRNSLMLDETSRKLTREDGKFLELVYKKEPNERLITILEQLHQDNNIDIILVSKTVLLAVRDTYPELAEKCRVPYNINNDTENAIYSSKMFIKDPI